MRTQAELEAALSDPSDQLIAAMSKLRGDLMVLGVGGKMGPSLARLAQTALSACSKSRVVGVARFSQEGLVEDLQSAGIETIACDLMDEDQLNGLPLVPNVVYMVGTKFGTTGDEATTWAVNTYLPGRIADRFRDSRIVALSTGNVYPLTPVDSGGPTEDDPTAPVGEYAQSCLGRERMLEHFSRSRDTPMTILRLNYAVDLRYGILTDLANTLSSGNVVDLTMGHVNVIWQGYANEVTLRSLNLCSVPPRVLNLTGPETVSVRWLATELGRRLGVEPIFSGEESPTALLSNASLAHRLFGAPRVKVADLIDWTAEWMLAGAPTLDKPTSFQDRQGKF